MSAAHQRPGEVWRLLIVRSALEPNSQVQRLFSLVARQGRTPRPGTLLLREALSQPRPPQNSPHPITTNWLFSRPPPISKLCPRAAWKDLVSLFLYLAKDLPPEDCPLPFQVLSVMPSVMPSGMMSVSPEVWGGGG